MESVREQSATPNGGSLLRYPLRSAAKSKDLKKFIDEPTVSSSTKRVRTTPNVAKSTSALDLSETEKSMKPPRRFSNPTKYTNSPYATPSGFMTPITEARRNRPKHQLSSDTPKSEASISSTRRKFCALSSASYWLTQIKLAESASKHSISLAFFQLAFDSGAEPLPRVREELKSYVLRHKLMEELGNSTKNILDSYNILQELEKLQVSEDGSQLEQGPQITDKIRKNSAEIPETRNLKPKALNVSNLAESNNDDASQKITPAAKKQPSSRNFGNTAMMRKSFIKGDVEKSPKPRKQKTRKGTEGNNSDKNSSSDEVVELNEAMLDEKENTHAKNLDTNGKREEIAAN
ncbi:hypothetical protein HPP92_024074 [Vanilla planifolia]|uniref:Uncharacterized protein n=1 Tax=Vanilla planifolia TaxID=51239 RepID=A0A835PRC2_VANPL|nr:hypothetical protein HPP92_024074 [Vanilla planifolia]